MNRNEKPRAVRLHDTKLDKEYVQWIYDIKQRFRNAQIKAAVKVNSEQLLFNWQLGRDLVVRKAEEKWGNGIVEQVSLDLQAAFPEAKGFSARNLWNMKKWYSFYTSYEDFGNAVNALSSQMDISSLKLQQVAAEKFRRRHQKKNCNKLLQKYHSRRYSDLSLGDIILR